MLWEAPDEVPKSRTRETGWFATAAAATVLIWAALGLLWAQLIVLPNPLLLPPPSFAELFGRIPTTPRPDRFIVMFFNETSLLLTAFAAEVEEAPWAREIEIRDPDGSRVRGATPED